MKQFEKWQEKREVKTIGYLNNSSAYNAGEEAGWRAALEWMLSQQGQIDWRFCPVILPGIIKKELKDE